MSTYSDVVQAYRRNYNPTAALLFDAACLPVEKTGVGARLLDESGKSYLDFCASYGILGLGYAHPEVNRALLRQLDNLQSGKNSPQAAADDLTESLRSVLPPSLSKFYLTVSGSEAVEIALRIAFAALPERRKIVAVENSYHGKTLGTLSVMGQPHLRSPFGEFETEVRFVPFGDADAMREAIGDDTLAVIVEPVLGGGYVNVPPPGYLLQIRELCTRFGALMLVDEVQTGFGRTGKMFAIEHDGVIPDVLVVSKGASGGQVPFALTAVHESVQGLLEKQQSTVPFFREPDYFSFPVICAVASAAIRAIQSEDLPEKARLRGERLRRGLESAARQRPAFLLEAPGMGLMLGVKVRNGLIENALWIQMLKRGVITGLSTNTVAEHPVLRFFPPLIVSDAEIDEALAALDASLDELSGLPLWVYDAMNRLFKYQFYMPKPLLKLGIWLLRNVPRMVHSSK